MSESTRINGMTAERLSEDIRDIKDDLKTIKAAISSIAVQDERIKRVEVDIETIWRKHDDHSTKIEAIQRWQASCPRGQIRWVWVVVAPLGLLMLAQGWAVIELIHKLGVTP